MILESFVGPSHTLQSRNPDVERTVNFFQESVTQAGKTDRTLRYTPGLTAFATTTGTPIRAMFSQDGRAFAVCGALFVEVDSAGTPTTHGTVALDGSPASMCSNGSAGDQILIISGGEGYIFTLSTDAFAIIADADFPHGTARMADFMDGYFLVLVEDSRQFRISALEDGTSWDALDVGERSEGSDNIQTLIRNHREIWLIGSKTSEVWYDNGDALFPFAPIQGVFMETGTSSPWSVARIDNTLAFLSLDERGQGVVYRMSGYTPERVSTYAQEAGIHGWGQSTGLDGALGFAQQQQGHLFYWLYIADLLTTWVYDVAEQAWHERALYDINAAEWVPHLAQCAMFAFDKALVGSRDSDVIYELDFGAYTP